MRRLNFALLSFVLLTINPLLALAQTTKYWSGTGDDANDGNSPTSAWRSPAKITAELAKRNNAISTLVVDTTQSPIELDSQLVIGENARGITVTSIDESLADLRAYKTLNNFEFYQPDAARHPNVWATNDAQPDIVLWELTDATHADSLFWYSHPVGTSYVSVADLLDSTDGSFWTDGATLYFNPRGLASPISNNKIYVRSRLYAGTESTHSDAIQIMTSATVEHLAIGGTTLAGAIDNSPDNGYAVRVTNGASTVLRDCYLYAWSKHAISAINGEPNGSLLVERVRAEQGSPYANLGGQSAFVSYSDGSGYNLNHIYRECRTENNAGLIGSTVGTHGDYTVFYSHVTGSTPLNNYHYRQLRIENCRFPRGGITNEGGVAPAQFVVENSLVGAITTYAEAIINHSTFDWGFASPEATAGRIRVTNSVFTPNAYPSDAKAIFRIRGTMDYENNVIDLADTPYSGLMMFRLYELVSFRFVGNTVKLKSNYSPTSFFTPFIGFLISDAPKCDFRNNIYIVPANRVFSENHEGGIRIGRPRTEPYYTFTGWQSAGFDFGSVRRDLLAGKIRVGQARLYKRN